MFTLNASTRLVRSFAPRVVPAAVLVILALFSTACGDAAARINAPTLRSSSTNGLSTTAPDFAVLANAAVTCTDGGITGNVGTFLSGPVGSLTRTGCPIAGNVQLGDSAAQRAFNAFLDSYATLAPRLGDVCTTLTGTLAGVILAPGDYCFDVAATVTGVLTLDGPSNGIWNIKVGTSGTGALTGTAFSVVMAGGGQACNVTWWVADAATMTGSDFRGNLLAGVAITLTGGTFNGHAWSRSDVTTTGTVVGGC